MTPTTSPPAAPARGRVHPPVALVAELTYRCPLRCGYCSNPLDLARYDYELSTEEWQRVIADAATLGVLQLHFSGGEPLVRDDLDALVRVARAADLYTNLITSAWGLDADRVHRLRDAGLDHVQISLQHVTSELADAVAGAKAHEKKLRAAREVKRAGIALSINVVLHRENIAYVSDIISLADSLGAERLELANSQYHGWALKNREALLPTREALDHAAEVARDARDRIGPRMEILYVLPDYYTDRPKPCMDGWGRRFVTVVPDGHVLPCAGAHELPLAFESVRDRSLRDLWFDSPAMNAYRGAEWMLEPCRSCEERDMDFGGCRCQAFALTGDARTADPACSLSPAHGVIESARQKAFSSASPAQVSASPAQVSASPAQVLYRLRTPGTG